MTSRRTSRFSVMPPSSGPVLDFLKHPNGIDDRKLLLEYVLTALATHPESATRKFWETETVKLLYNDLAHPPATYIGPGHSFRSPDGSGNNLSDPSMGKAGTPYARSVQQSHPLPQNQLPDPDLIFETLLKRDGFQDHPAGLSSMMFSFAALVIHTVFRTSHERPWNNETSSYVDLAPLYGHNEEELNKIRLPYGRGLLKPDTFSEDRLLLLPPAVCCLLILFNRNHNYIARKLLEINERGTWRQDPETAFDVDKPEDQSALRQQDDEIFGIARLVNCGWFGSCVFSDYFASILGLVRLGSSWSLNPFGEIRNLDHSLFDRGRGNVCSVEFNCLYRWHATTSEADAKWVEDMLAKYFHKPADQANFKDFMVKYQTSEDKDPSHWTFGEMQRQSDEMFKDSDLGKWIKNAMEHPAGAFRARGTPAVMQLHETMGIRANRGWGVCSLNDFRRWNPNPEIAETAERLYGDIENLELYVGLQAEEAKQVVDGAGLCPGYTISRAILADAIALTRGDRFFTADYTPYNMTAWGFADCQRDANGPGNGSMLGRLLMRTLPGEFSPNSTYAWFPLQTPVSMKGFLEKLGNASQYDFDRPVDAMPRVALKEYRDVEAVLKSREYVAPYGKKAARVIAGTGYLFSGITVTSCSLLFRFFIATNNSEQASRSQSEVLRCLTLEREEATGIVKYFYNKTKELLQKKSFSMTGVSRRNVDIVQDVLKYIPLHWVVTEIAGIPLQTKDTHGVFTEAEMYDKVSDIYEYLFLDVDKGKEMRLEQHVKEHVADLKQLIEESARGRTSSRFSIAGIVNTISGVFSRQKRPQNVLTQRLMSRGSTEAEVTNNILALMVGATVELSQCLVNAVNMYFQKQTEVGAKLAKADATSEDMKGFIYESMRLDPPFRGVYREAVSNQTVGDVSIKKGQQVFLDFAAASLDEDVFPKPTTIDLQRRPAERYVTGDGATRYRTTTENSLLWEYLGKDQLPTPWPHGSYILQYDAPIVTNGTAAN
ncbi:linoleate diol synthase [Vararia minispora EC-137]|uniref:Linoleate diol synthase n=1 Tax=Vararia minispora EC-137 TaxID=1314806 RepID=A0ACB8QVC5_9AGAM|nr:linoleate diol synthase [Vararia minispora EC-137]